MALGAAVLEGNPHVDEVFKVSCRGMAAKFSHLNTLRRTRYDIGILAQHSLANAAFLWSLGCKQRVGIDSKGCGLFLTHRVPTMGLVHEVTRYLKLAEALGANGDSSGLEFFTTEADRQSIAHFLFERGYDLQQRDGETTDRTLSRLKSAVAIQTMAGRPVCTDRIKTGYAAQCMPASVGWP